MRTISKKTAFRITAVGGMSLLVAAAIAPGAIAAGTIDGDVKVSNTETVQVLMDATGKIASQRVYDQLVLTGKGNVDLANPVSTKGLRNLDGFGGYDVRDGKVRVKTDVDGTKKFRSVSDFTKKLPLDISVGYFLDGKKVDPGDVVGKNGDLEVRYRVTNNTGVSQDVPFKDGMGADMTSPESVVIPMVGTLTTTLPSNFTKVKSAEANAAGDGRGGTTLSFTMTLFPPIGKNYADFGYTAHVKDGLIPKASISALPVNPLENPSFKGGAESYKGGAETGADLTAGATEIDANVLKLRDGANELVAGIMKLQTGAGQLSAGLNDEAAPGAKKLADGAGKIEDGADALAGGLKTAKSGSTALPAGLGQIVDGLDSVEAGLKKLLDDAVNPAIAGIGTTSPGVTVLYAVTAVRAGLQGAIADVTASRDEIPAKQQGLTCAALVLKDIAGGPDAPGACFGGTRPPTLNKDTDVNPTKRAVLGTVATQLDQGAADLNGNIADLNTLIGGLGSAVTNLGSAACGIDSNISGCDPAKPGILQALLGIKLGVGTPNDGFKSNGDPKSLRTGVKALHDGAEEAQEGSKSLVSGLGKLSSGANQLELGTDLLDSGAGSLASGLTGAATGSSQLADGLNQAAASAPALPEGADRLSKEGTKKLIAAGDKTASDYGLKYALIAAGADRAATAQPYGSPEGATQLTAYSFDLAGADGTGSANVKRGIAAIALLAIAGGAATIRRRVVG